MNDKEKRKMFMAIVVLAIVILLAAGSSFAYFQASTNSSENAVNAKAAEFKISLDDDISLIKAQIIPSIEEYVDIASARRDASGNLLKPYEDEETGQMITEGTACIDDNLKEICSIYTFTITNDSLDTALPLYITLIPSINTFENLYFKIIDKDNNVVMNATHIVDDRYLLDSNGNYQKDEDGNLIKKDDFDSLTPSPIVLSGINNTLPKSTDGITKSSVTYSIVMWVMEMHKDQTEEDSGKVFASTLSVKASGADGKGITGTISTAGIE